MCSWRRWYGRYWYRAKHKEYEKEDAVDFLINSFNQQPGEITLVTLGPLTNIALVQKDPSIIKRLNIVMSWAELDGRKRISNCRVQHLTPNSF